MEPKRSLVALAISICFFSGIAAQAQNAAVLQVEKATHDYGKVSQGTKVKHEFIISNKGNAELKIEKLVSSCGCTASQASSEAIQPGAQGKIFVEFDTSGFSGEKIKTVQLYSNDPLHPMETLTLTGVIEPDLEIEPRNIFFKEVIKGSAEASAAQEVSIKVRDGVQAEIVSFKSYSPHILVKELDTNPRHKRILITISPDAPTGELRDRVVVNMKGANLSSVNIPVFALVRGDLKLSTNSLSFGIIDPKLKEQLKRSVKLENSGAKPVNIQKIVSSDEAVKASYKTIKGGRIYLIEVEVDPLKVKTALRASLDIVTDGAETLSLNVYGVTPPTA